jgi:hypothetical protein
MAEAYRGAPKDITESTTYGLITKITKLPKTTAIGFGKPTVSLVILVILKVLAISRWP